MTRDVRVDGVVKAIVAVSKVVSGDLQNPPYTSS
jgi:hypothetical protein